MILIKRVLASVALLCLTAQVQATVQVEQLDYDSLLINDCSQSAITISTTQSSVMTQLEKLSLEARSTINDSILVATLPSLNIDAQQQNYRNYSPNNKKINFNSSKSSDFPLSYAWREQSFEWFSAYNSNQSQLKPAPYLALARYQGQTLALASISSNNSQQLLSALNDDFIAQRSPLIVFVKAHEPLSKSAIGEFQRLGMRLHFKGQLIIASKAIDVCDSGNWSDKNGQLIKWIKIDRVD
ncbi:hypothetical protein [Agarivorans aestuarii]|uniref:hypothetical protein n=1 Tax=Agarivorans aestuarii TaxID=1563703 RepID=UPI002E77DBDD|nr:hypothetical protein [Agarivorans aestuarii]